MSSVNREINAGSLEKRPGFFVGAPMWPFNALNAIRRDLRILAQGNLILIERLKLMSAQTEAFKVALDGFMARQSALSSEVQPLKDQLTAVMAERDEANAALVEATAKMDAA